MQWWELSARHCPDNYAAIHKIIHVTNTYSYALETGIYWTNWLIDRHDCQDLEELALLWHTLAQLYSKNNQYENSQKAWELADSLLRERYQTAAPLAPSISQ